VANEKKEIKVTDKRMFTPEGELREEYRFLGEKSTSAAPVETAPAPPPPPAKEARSEPPRPAREEAFRAAPQGYPDPQTTPPLDLPGTSPELGGPGFYDLVASLAEPALIYLGDAPLPDGQDATNLEMARLHIDLLDVLRRKTAGNLTAQESAYLEDLLYRLRVRYVQKRG